MVPLQRTPVEYRDLRQLTTFTVAWVRLNGFTQKQRFMPMVYKGN